MDSEKERSVFGSGALSGGRLLSSRQRSSACQIHASGDEDNAEPIGFARPLGEERDSEQGRKRRHQGAERCAPRGTKNDNGTAIENNRNDSHENALENSLYRQIGERYRSKARSGHRDIDR